MQKNIVRIAGGVVLILLIPVFGNLFVEGWNWGIGDFIFAFVLLFATGLAIDLAARKISHPVHRTIAIIAILLTLILLWVELATDGVSRALTSVF